MRTIAAYFMVAPRLVVVISFITVVQASHGQVQYPLDENNQATLSSLENFIDQFDVKNDLAATFDGLITGIEALTNSLTDVWNAAQEAAEEVVEDVEEAAEDVVDCVTNPGDCVDGIFVGGGLILADNGISFAFEPEFINGDLTPDDSATNLQSMEALPEETTSTAISGSALSSSLTGALFGTGLPSSIDNNPNVGISSLDVSAYPGVIQNPTFTDAAFVHPVFHGEVDGLLPADFGLDFIDNTSDTNKPVPLALESALMAKSEWVDVPTDPFDVCSTGEMALNEEYIFTCISPNTWSRIALESW